jgi:hypothetical protein
MNQLATVSKVNCLETQIQHQPYSWAASTPPNYDGNVLMIDGATMDCASFTSSFLAGCRWCFNSDAVAFNESPSIKDSHIALKQCRQRPRELGHQRQPEQKLRVKSTLSGTENAVFLVSEAVEE